MKNMILIAALVFSAAAGAAAPETGKAAPDFTATFVII